MACVFEIFHINRYWRYHRGLMIKQDGGVLGYDLSDMQPYVDEAERKKARAQSLGHVPQALMQRLMSLLNEVQPAELIETASVCTNGKPSAVAYRQTQDGSLQRIELQRLGEEGRRVYVHPSDAAEEITDILERAHHEAFREFY